jgi:hypothetical protein
VLPHRQTTTFAGRRGKQTIRSPSPLQSDLVLALQGNTYQPGVQPRGKRAAQPKRSSAEGRINGAAPCSPVIPGRTGKNRPHAAGATGRDARSTIGLPTARSAFPDDLKRPHAGAIIVIVTRDMPEETRPPSANELVQPTSQARRLTVVLP